MGYVARVGGRAIGAWRNASLTAAVLWGVLCLAARRRHWSRTVRAVFGRQILFTGVDALRMAGLVALLTGVSVVLQAQVWLSRFGQSEMTGPLLVAVIIREMGPLLVTFLVIGRSGTAIATELAGMRVRGEVRVLEALGVDPMLYLVMPRVLGVVLSVFGLSVAFVLTSFASGYLIGLLMNVIPRAPMIFLASVLKALTPVDVGNFFVKTLLPPAVMATICCIEGLRVGGSATEVPQAATRAVVRSIAAVLWLSALISVLTYV